MRTISACMCAFVVCACVTILYMHVCARENYVIPQNSRYTHALYPRNFCSKHLTHEITMYIIQGRIQMDSEKGGTIMLL